MGEVHIVAGTAAGALSPEEVDSFEQIMGVDMPGFKLDASYLRFLARSNGGVPVEKYFSTVAGERYYIDRFLNLADPSSASEEQRMLNLQQTWNLIEDRLVAGMYPFAALPGGDFLVFVHSDHEPSPVRLWLHERSEEGEPWTAAVAENFDALVSQLSQHE